MKDIKAISLHPGSNAKCKPSQSNSRLKEVDKHLADTIMSEIVDSTNLSPSLSDVVGLESVKSALNEAVILPSVRPDLFTGLRIPPK